MSKFFTRTGDDGFTSRLGKGRLPKHHNVIEAVGALDEASAILGVARALVQSPRSVDLILTIQRDLYSLMAEVSASEEAAPQFRIIDETKVAWLEEQIESLGKDIEMPKEFIVPGDSLPGAILAQARTSVRKAERRVARLQSQREVDNNYLVRYLNRLSSLCFILELVENKKNGISRVTLAKDRP